MKMQHADGENYEEMYGSLEEGQVVYELMDGESLETPV
jgi:hypothetical protein